MRYGLVSELARTVSRFALIGAIGSLAAACSSDAMRLSGTPFANPFSSEQSSEPGLTGSVDQPVAAAPMPRSSVRSAPLAAPAQKVASAPVYNRPPALEPATSARPVAGMNPASGMNPAASRPAAAPTRVAAPAPAPAPDQGRMVSRTQLAAAKPAAPVAAPAAEKLRVRPGLVAAKPAPEPVKVAKAPEPKPVAAEAKSHPRPGRQVAAAAEKAAPVKEPAKVAKVEPKPETGKVLKSEPLKVAKAEPAKPAPVAAAQPKPAEPVKVAAKPAPAPQKVAAAEPVKPEPAKPAREPESTASLPAQPAAPSAEFRWPARGRVITGFGGSGSNEGINIAVPDGTPVKAAESGTVAYAGSEVKGYGNLVLIRHDNGYVSAYAHNGEIEVKRGQKVNRGQTIAKSGQSGNVTSPQLHFEIRKGSQPVDPMQYLASN
jgi:murein DD-endopeptidase MepM/ murein hydrolase activator NlpD